MRPMPAACSCVSFVRSFVLFFVSVKNVWAILNGLFIAQITIRIRGFLWQNRVENRVENRVTPPDFHPILDPIFKKAFCCKSGGKWGGKSGGVTRFSTRFCDFGSTKTHNSGFHSTGFENIIYPDDLKKSLKTTNTVNPAWMAQPHDR